jgi:DNA modification methylase
MNINLINGDCLKELTKIQESSVDSIITDPPYGLSFMGKKWDYDVPSVEVWKECLRVLKPGGHLLAFAGTRTQHRMAVRIEDAGFEIRDMIAWVYGSGFPKSHNGEWGGTALKPALEPITMARKPLIGTVAENFSKYGMGGMNVDGCRVGSGNARVHIEKIPNKHNGTWNYGAFANSGTSAGVTTMGRWPANLIHDGSEEVVGLFPQSGGGHWSYKQAKDGGIYKHGLKDMEGVGTDKATGSAARFFYCAKASKRDRDEGLESFPNKQASGLPMRSAVGEKGGEGLDGTTTDRLTTRKNTHPTVKPTGLMRYLCRLVTPKDGTVLDPFMGSGSTGKAALLEGFNFIGIEMEAEYIEIASSRISAVQPTLI